MKIYPSLISADILNLSKVISGLNKACDGYHIDVMDDHFVPNLTWGPAFVNAICSSTNLSVHLHLMVDDPIKWVNRVDLKKEDIFIFHHEVVSNFQDINKIKSNINSKLGVAVNPETSINKIFSYLSILDHVLIMSVKPGFSGQKFIPEVLDKATLLYNYRKEKKLNFTIGMDGGVGLSNIKIIAESGVDEVGVASAIFLSRDPILAVDLLYKSL